MKSILLILLTITALITETNCNKGQSQFERMFKECSSTPQCMRRPNDDNCLYQCVNKECYDELIGNTNLLIEYGEIDSELKKTFEKCYGFKTREKGKRRNKERGK